MLPFARCRHFSHNTLPLTTSCAGTWTSVMPSKKKVDDEKKEDKKDGMPTMAEVKKAATLAAASTVSAGIGTGAVKGGEEALQYVAGQVAQHGIPFSF